MSEKGKYVIPKDKLNAAKKWEIGISKPTSNGGRVLLLDNNVTLVVGGEIDANGNVIGGRVVNGGIFFQATDDKLEFLQGLADSGKINPEFVENFSNRIAKSGADRIAEAQFEYSRG